MGNIEFINFSNIQFFVGPDYSDAGDGDNNANLGYDEDSNNISNKNEPLDIVNDLGELENQNNVESQNDKTKENKDKDNFNIHRDTKDLTKINNDKSSYHSKIKLEHLGTGNEDTFPLKPPQVQSKVLNNHSNTPKIPDGNRNGVIIKTPVVLAQLVIPINISSYIYLPQPAFKIRDIEQNLILEESTLLQPSDILFIKGFVSKNIEYIILNSSNSSNHQKETINYSINIPFECSTSVDFFTRPLAPVANTKEILHHGNEDFSDFNQVSKEFFNEMPFCNPLSSKITEFNRYLDKNGAKRGFAKVQDIMTIELKIEILQNQPVIIPSSINDNTKA